MVRQQVAHILCFAQSGGVGGSGAGLFPGTTRPCSPNHEGQTNSPSNHLSESEITASAEGLLSKMDNSAFILPGIQTSSESRNEIRRPVARFNPVFLAAAGPLRL